MILDNILVISILLVFVGALLGGYLQRRKKDRVLKAMNGFHITARRNGAPPVWGKALVYPNALELLFTRPHINVHANRIVSYILFRDRLDQLLGLYRYHDELTPDNQRKRLKEVHKVLKRGFGAKILRQSINFINTFRDAINESMGLLMTRVKGVGAGSALLGSNNDRLQKIGTQAVGMVGNSWDPVLERYIGRRVVVELLPEGMKIEEYAGLLKEYSKNWISLFDCRQSELSVLPLNDIDRLTMQRLIDFTMMYTLEENQVVLTFVVTNRSDKQIEFDKLSADDFTYALHQEIGPEETAKWVVKNIPAELTDCLQQDTLPLILHLNAADVQQTDTQSDASVTELQLPPIDFSFLVIREVDVFLPRGIAVLRHAAEYV